MNQQPLQYNTWYHQPASIPFQPSTVQSDRTLLRSSEEAAHT